ncbi:MAG TPA: M20 family metallopeptidase [Longimicrobiales bacterium]
MSTQTPEPDPTAAAELPRGDDGHAPVPPGDAGTAPPHGAAPAAASAAVRAILDDPAPIEARILDRLRAWVEHETPSGDASACAALAADIGDVLAAAGASIEWVDAPGRGRHLVARVPGREAALEPVVVLGHLDTVHPRGTLAERPFRVVGGRAEGPGTYDMKAGLALVAEALLLFHETGTAPRRPVTVLVTCDEEIGSGTSRALIEATARGAAAVLVPEPPLPGGAAKTGRKGVAGYRILTHGRASHAGLEPEKGVNAILELAHQTIRAMALAEPDRGTTISVGRTGGGTATNVVPAEAWAELDVRFTTVAEQRRVDDALRALTPVLPGARVTVEGGENRPPLEQTAGVLRLYRHARALAAELGFELGEGVAGGASDGNFTGALGVPTLDGLGPMGGGAHSVDEHVVVADLTRRAALYARLLETL